ncbi:MAG: cytochrome C oxidase subunit IV family protein [Anaerolineae bacterium]|nr:cytochrome C oxidase subunit IV family protein [Anaerolineae bacterium]
MPDEDKILTDDETGEPIKATPEYTEGEAERLPEPETGIEAAVAEAVEDSEKAAKESPVVQGFDEAVTSIQEGFDALDHDESEVHPEDFSNTTVIMGRSITVPGGIYTVVFGALGVATLIEILLAELPRGFFTIPLMVGLALAKAILVVMYYMHLKEDSRIFTYTLLLPLGLALIAGLFLLAVPITGY